MKYIVWIGGIEDIITSSKKEAYSIAKEWLNLGYDDVIIEEVTLWTIYYLRQPIKVCYLNLLNKERL